jgi:hypothetical protein
MQGAYTPAVTSAPGSAGKAEGVAYCHTHAYPEFVRSPECAQGGCARFFYHSQVRTGILPLISPLNSLPSERVPISFGPPDHMLIRVRM